MGKTDSLQEDLVIEIEGLTKSYSDRLALRNVNLKLRRGESVAILGPNGAGKTTLLRILATIAKPTSGEIIVNGYDMKKHSAEIRQHIGVVSHNTFLYRDLTGYENLLFYSRMYDVSDIDTRIKEVSDLVGMTARLDDRIDTLSRGMQQRLSIARSLLHNPSIMLLDEPDTGLDRHALSTLWQIVLAEGDVKRSILFTTHDLEWGYHLSDYILVLDRGRIIYKGEKYSLSLENLSDIYSERTGVNL